MFAWARHSLKVAFSAFNSMQQPLDASIQVLRRKILLSSCVHHTLRFPMDWVASSLHRNVAGTRSERLVFRNTASIRCSIGVLNVQLLFFYYSSVKPISDQSYRRMWQETGITWIHTAEKHRAGCSSVFISSSKKHCHMSLFGLLYILPFTSQLSYWTDSNMTKCLFV